MTEVLVVGGGITGLVCAFELARAGVDVQLREAAPRSGGVVRTRVESGFQLEDGPNTVPASARHLRELCADLGIADRLVPSLPETDTRYLYHRGRLVALPHKPPALLTSPLLSLAGKLRLLSEPLRAWREVEDPEPSFEAFLERRIGRQAARRLGGAFVRGIFASEASELGAASAFPRLFDSAREHGGLFRALRATRRAPSTEAPGPRVKRSALLSLPGGFGELIDRMDDELGGRVRTGARAEVIEPVPGGWNVTCTGATERADHLILALPSRPTADLLEGHLPAGTLADLREVAHADVTVVHVGLLGTGATLVPPGFGFLVPPEESGPDAPRVLGMLFPSNLFPDRAPEHGASLTAIYRTADREGMDDATLVEGVLEDLERALGARPSAEVVASACVRWPQAIPRYSVGHRSRMQRVLEAAATLEGVTLAGNWHGGVSIDDRVAAGRTAARALLGQGSAA